jgi:hypothetical protein
MDFHLTSVSSVDVIQLSNHQFRQRRETGTQLIHARTHCPQMGHQAAPLMKDSAATWTCSINGKVLHKGAIMMDFGSMYCERFLRGKNHCTFFASPRLRMDLHLVQWRKRIVLQ